MSTRDWFDAVRHGNAWEGHADTPPRRRWWVLPWRRWARILGAVK